MKRYIKSSMNPDILSYAQKEEIAKKLFRIVSKYFQEAGYGSPSPCVSYSQYDIKEYTFRINSGTYNRSVSYEACVDGYNTVDLNEFKAAVRSALKEYGFKKVAFDLGTRKYKGDQNTGYYSYTVPVYTYKILNAIYFAE